MDKFVSTRCKLLHAVQQNNFSGFEIYFQGSEIYFQGLEIDFRATEKVFIRGMKEKCTRREEKVYVGKRKSVRGAEKFCYFSTPVYIERFCRLWRE